MAVCPNFLFTFYELSDLHTLPIWLPLQYASICPFPCCENSICDVRLLSVRILKIYIFVVLSEIFSTFFVNSICVEHRECIRITFLCVDIWTVVSGHKVSDFCPDWKFSEIRLYSMHTTVGQQEKLFRSTLEIAVFVVRDFEKMEEMEEFWV